MAISYHDWPKSARKTKMEEAAAQRDHEARARDKTRIYLEQGELYRNTKQRKETPSNE